MTQYLKHVRSSLRAASIALSIFAVGACSADSILEVTDPDIINPDDVSTAPGANAVRIGALARLNSATSGAESLFLYGGLLADEWRSGDTFAQRDETDQRSIDFSNGNINTAFRNVQRARLSAQQAESLLEQFAPQAPAWQRAEMYLVQAYTENLMTEHFCSGLPFSSIIDGVETYGEQQTTEQSYARALAHADSGLALITGTTANDLRVQNALRVTRARILVNTGRFADAAAAVAGVSTGFVYEMQHSQTTNDNAIWALNNSGRRYTVGNGDGGNGLNFVAAADPRLPTCVGGSELCRSNGVTQARVFDTQSTLPLNVQLIWPTRESSVAILSGIAARLIEAEAQLQAGNAGQALATLNALRTTEVGLAPLSDAGSPAAQLDQLFRERAFWLFSTGYRLGDLRRLVRQYGRNAENVFPTGTFNKGGVYGNDVNIPITQAEENNPNVPAGQTCLNRDA